MKVEAFHKKRKQLSEFLPPSERHKLKVERPRPSAAAINSPARAVVLEKSNDNSLMESPSTTTGSMAGKRRPSDPETETEMSLSGDSSRMTTAGAAQGGTSAVSGTGNNGGFNNVTNGEAQPPLKRSNTANETPMNGNNGLEVS